MNLGMAIRTAVDKKLLNSSRVIEGMTTMALETQKWHGNGQKSSINRSVRSVTIGAVLSYISVFERKWPLFFHMTTGTGLFRRSAT